MCLRRNETAIAENSSDFVDVIDDAAGVHLEQSTAREVTQVTGQGVGVTDAKHRQLSCEQLPSHA